MAFEYFCEACQQTLNFSCWRTERFSICTKCNMPAAIPMWRKKFDLKPCAAEKAFWDKECDSMTFATTYNQDDRLKSHKSNKTEGNGNGNGKPKAEKTGKNGKRK